MKNHKQASWHNICCREANYLERHTMEISSSGAATKSISTATATPNKPGNAANFADSLADAVKSTGNLAAAFVSGRLGVDLNSDGIPLRMVYLDQEGNRLTTSAFCAESILRNTQQLGISLNDLKGLGTQLDAAGVGYKPYELYRGTGSDHGIDFDDLIAGGLGTAYDWTRDANVADKGPGAIRRLEEAAALAQSLQLVAHAEVTQNKGIDPTRFATQAATGESPRHYVMFNGSVAAWYGSSEQAEQASRLYGGSVTDLAPRASSTAVGIKASNSSSGASPVNSDGATQAATSSSASATSWNDRLQALIDAIHESIVPTNANPLGQVLARWPVDWSTGDRQN